MDTSIPVEVINPPLAHELVAAAVDHARQLEVHIAAAVVDRSGHLVAFLRSEQGPFMSIDIAIDKAYTSASFGIASSQWDELLPQGTTLRSGILSRDRFVGFGGGMPIIVNDQLIGAIGVSGASEEQDEACAKAALHHLI